MSSANSQLLHSKSIREEHKHSGNVLNVLLLGNLKLIYVRAVITALLLCKFID